MVVEPLAFLMNLIAKPFVESLLVDLLRHGRWSPNHGTFGKPFWSFFCIMLSMLKVRKLRRKHRNLALWPTAGSRLSNFLQSSGRPCPHGNTKPQKPYDLDIEEFTKLKGSDFPKDFPGRFCKEVAFEAPNQEVPDNLIAMTTGSFKGTPLSFHPKPFFKKCCSSLKLLNDGKLSTPRQRNTSTNIDEDPEKSNGVPWCSKC